MTGEKLAAVKIVGLLLTGCGARKCKELVDGVHAACAEYVAGGEEPAVGESELKLAEDLLSTIAREKTCERLGSVTGSLAVEVVARGD